MPASKKKVPTISIHGKEYVTVATRVSQLHDDTNNFTEGRTTEIITEVLSHDPVVIKAAVKTARGLFTGISSVSLGSSRMIEKQNPYEVAETSAVGRALGFAGYGSVDSIASADEMHKSANSVSSYQDDGMVRVPTDEAINAPVQEVICEVCGAAAEEKRGTTKAGKPYHGIFCSTQDRSHTRWLWN